MSRRVESRLAPLAGVAFVAFAFVGVLAGAKPRVLSAWSSSADVAHAVFAPAGVGAWIPAYFELLGFGCFLAFAVWVCARLGGGVLGAVARAFATAYAAVGIAALAVADSVTFSAGKGISVPTATSLVTVGSALYVCTWFLSAFFLLALAPLALAHGRRGLGGGAIAVAALTLVLTPVSAGSLGQTAQLLWFAWVVYASVALAGRVPSDRRGVALAA